ncbi:MAG: tetratricopeptide repeat protein [Candidatus Omnitrophica bacterium]|nr:tetratricopeptide repeat protein [Candidatus Omnitrophota bacterium]
MSKTLKHELDIIKFTKEIEKNVNDCKAYVNRGFSYYYKGDYDRAIADFTKAIEIDPAFFTPYNNRGNCYLQTGRYDLAIADFSVAIKLRPHNGIPYNNRGFAHMMQGNLKEAEEDIQKSLELNKNNIYAMNSMAELCAVKNKPEDACKWLKMAIAKGYNNWKYLKTSKTYDNIRSVRCFKEILKEITAKEH